MNSFFSKWFTQVYNGYLIFVQIHVHVHVPQHFIPEHVHATNKFVLTTDISWKIGYHDKKNCLNFSICWGKNYLLTKQIHVLWILNPVWNGIKYRHCTKYKSENALTQLILHVLPTHFCMYIPPSLWIVPHIYTVQSSIQFMARMITLVEKPE